MTISCVRSDHFSIVAYSGESITCYNKSKRICQIRRRSPEQKATFISSVTEIDLGVLQTFVTIQEAFDSFYSQVIEMMDRFFPLKSVTLTDREASYITPATKVMIRKKNSLMRTGRVGEASALASKNATSFFSVQPLIRLWTRVAEGATTTAHHKIQCPKPQYHSSFSTYSFQPTLSTTNPCLWQLPNHKPLPSLTFTFSTC